MADSDGSPQRGDRHHRRSRSRSPVSPEWTGETPAEREEQRLAEAAVLVGPPPPAQGPEPAEVTAPAAQAPSPAAPPRGGAPDAQEAEIAAPASHAAAPTAAPGTPPTQGVAPAQESGASPGAAAAAEESREGTRGVATAAPASRATASAGHAATPSTPRKRGNDPARATGASPAAAAAAAVGRESAKYRAHANPTHTHTSPPKPFPPKPFPPAQARHVRPQAPERSPPGITLPQLQRQRDARRVIHEGGDGAQAELRPSDGSAERGTGGDRGSAQERAQRAGQGIRGREQGRSSGAGQSAGSGRRDSGQGSGKGPGHGKGALGRGQGAQVQGSGRGMVGERAGQGVGDRGRDPRHGQGAGKGPKGKGKGAAGPEGQAGRGMGARGGGRAEGRGAGSGAPPQPDVQPVRCIPPGIQQMPAHHTHHHHHHHHHRYNIDPDAGGLVPTQPPQPQHQPAPPAQRAEPARMASAGGGRGAASAPQAQGQRGEPARGAEGAQPWDRDWGTVPDPLGEEALFQVGEVYGWLCWANQGTTRGMRNLPFDAVLLRRDGGNREVPPGGWAAREDRERVPRSVIWAAWPDREPTWPAFLEGGAVLRITDADANNWPPRALRSALAPSLGAAHGGAPEQYGGRALHDPPVTAARSRRAEEGFRSAGAPGGAVHGPPLTPPHPGVPTTRGGPGLSTAGRHPEGEQGGRGTPPPPPPHRPASRRGSGLHPRPREEPERDPPPRPSRRLPQGPRRTSKPAPTRQDAALIAPREGGGARTGVVWGATAPMDSTTPVAPALLPAQGRQGDGTRQSDPLHRACRPRGQRRAPTAASPRRQHVDSGPQQPAQWAGSRGRGSA